MSLYRYAGLLSPVIALASIAIAILTHPWFSFTENAISDLGALSVDYNYILNYGLIVSGALGVIFSVGLYRVMKSSISKLGSFLVLLGCIFLVLVGLFPEGLEPHFYVSVLFFVVTAVGVFMIGIGILRDNRHYATVTLLLISTGVALSVLFLSMFPGVAIAELMMSLTFSAWMILTSEAILS